MNILTKAQKKAFIKIIEDIIKEARDSGNCIRRSAITGAISATTEYNYSIDAITREALENFEDELGEGAP